MLHCRWVISNVVGPLLCSKKVSPVWHTCILLLLFQTICFLWPRCLHCCPQRNDLSPSDVSEQRSLDLRSWPSCVGRLFCLPNVQICAVLAALNSINYITLFIPGCLKWTRIWCLLKILPSFSDVPATQGMTTLWYFPISSSLSAVELVVLRKVQFFVMSLSALWFRILMMLSLWWESNSWNGTLFEEDRSLKIEVYRKHTICPAQSKKGRLSPLTSSCVNLMLLSTEFLCSVKASTSLVLTLTQVSSTSTFLMVANLYMEEVESRTSVNFIETAPSHWFRYVDDVSVKIK